MKPVNAPSTSRRLRYRPMIIPDQSSSSSSSNSFHHPQPWIVDEYPQAFDLTHYQPQTEDPLGLHSQEYQYQPDSSQNFQNPVIKEDSPIESPLSQSASEIVAVHSDDDLHRGDIPHKELGGAQIVEFIIRVRSKI